MIARVLLLIHLFAWRAMAAEINTYRGEAIREFSPILNEWAIKQYRKFPYLYISQGEMLPYDVLCGDPNAFVLFAEKNGEKVGTLSAHPLDSSSLNLKYSPISKLGELEEKGYDPGKILYVASFLVADEERENRTLIEEIYLKSVALAKQMGMTKICYFTTLREENHPLKPVPYIPVEPWEGFHFYFSGITFDLSWPTLQEDGSVKECVSTQAIYMHDL